MKKRRLLYLFPLASLVLSGCSIQDVGAWINSNVINPVKDLITGKKKGEQEEENHEEGHHDEEQHEQQEPEVEHTYTVHSNAYEHWKIRDDGVEEGREAHKFETVAASLATCTDVSHEELKCTECGFSKIINGHEHLEHQYSSRITKQATCQEEGEITFKCDLCGDEHIHKFSEPEAHHLVIKSTEGAVTTYKCDVAGCNFEKTVIDASTQTSAEVDTQDLKDTGEIQLQEAAIAFDEDTLDEFGSNVTISAESQDVTDVVNELNLDAEAQEKLADKPIIDFSVTDGGEQVSEFAGSVKITVDYELKQGESPDGITIWYLSEDGTEPIPATYVNQKVSFETTHFSYYAVVHLTPEEACATFGHEMVPGGHVASTCAAHGYDDMICRRCGKLDRQLAPLASHDFHYVEKLDPTTTSEGYIRYECSVCHEQYDTVLAKIESTERPFYVNLVYSLMTPEFKLYSTSTEGGETSTYESYTGLDYEGERFSYTTSGYSYYKGYTYYDDYEGYENWSLSGPNFALIRQIIDYIPDIYKQKVDEIAGWAFDKYLLKEEVPEGYKFTINFEALQQSIASLLDDDLETAIKGIIGVENFDKIFGFIAQHYEGTIGELIEDLESRGFLMQDLYEAAVNIAKLLGMDEENIPALNAIITDDIKNLKVYEAINMFADMLMNSGSHNTAEEAHEEPQPDPYFSRDPEQGGDEGHEEGQGEQGQSGLLPETYAEFKEMIDGFLSQNLIDLIASFMHQEASQLKSMVKSITDQINENHVREVLLTTKDGGFISLESEVKNFEAPFADEDLEYGYSLITKNFDKAEIISRLEEKAAKYQIRKNAFNPSLDHYQWLAKPYEDYYSKDYPGIKFEYYEKYDNNGYFDALISNKEILTGREENQKGRLVLRIPTYKYNDRGSVVINNYGLGTVLGQGETGLICNTANIIYYSSSYIVKEGDLTTEVYGSSAPEFGILFNFKDQSYHYTDKEGSFSYLYGDYCKYELSSIEEMQRYYAENYHHPVYVDDFDLEHTIVIKETNLFSGSVWFNVRNDQYDPESAYHVGSTYVLSKNMNETALEHANQFMLGYYIQDGQIVEALDKGSYSWLDFDAGHYNYYDDEELSRTYTYNQSYGNVSVSYTNKPGSAQYKCMRSVSWKISVNSNGIKSGNHKVHLFGSEWVIETPYPETKPGEDACHQYVTYSRQCSICGKYHSDITRYETHHVGELVECHEFHEVTATTAGYDWYYYVCGECGEFDHFDYERCSYTKPCRHENGHAENGQFICDDCGYVVDSPSGERPELIYEQYEIDSDSWLAYSVFAPSLYSEFSYLALDNYYSIQLCVGYFDESGEFHVFANGNESDIYWRRIYLSDICEHPYHYSWTYTNLVVFRKQAYLELLAEAQASNPDQEFVVTIAAVAKDAPEGDVQVFYYTIDQQVNP